MKIPKKMKVGLYTGKRKIEVRKINIPELKPGYVLIRIKACGICGSDLHSYVGLSPRRNFNKWLELKYPDGHELVGLVVKKGQGVKKVKIGSYVAAECFTHCGECEMCKNKRYNICFNRKDIQWDGPGGFGEYAIIHESALYEINKDIPFKEAIMLEPLAASYRAVKLSGLKKEKSILVIGAGTIGLLAAAIANLDTETVAIVAKYNHQEVVAKKLGINNVFQANTDTIKEAWNFIPEGFDIVIETTGTEKGLDMALNTIKKGSRIVLMGGYTKKVSVDIGKVVGFELQLFGSLCYGWSEGKKDFEEAIKLIYEKKINISYLVTHIFKINQISKAFETALDKKNKSIKVVVNMD